MYRQQKETLRMKTAPGKIMGSCKLLQKIEGTHEITSDLNKKNPAEYPH